MKFTKSHKILLVVLALSAGFYVLFINQHFARTFRVPSSSNAPAINVGEIVFATNLYEYENLDFIVFQKYDSIFAHKDQYYVFRLIAQEGDTLQIDKGIAYVNGFNVDKQLTLKHAYLCKRKELLMYQKADPSTEGFLIRDDFALVNMKDDRAKDLGLKRHMEDPTKNNTSIYNAYGTSWTPNYFGPYIIPKDHVFVMGDNRDNAMDSRMMGPIDVSSIKSVIKRR